jgi:hypothetical protein
MTDEYGLAFLETWLVLIPLLSILCVLGLMCCVLLDRTDAFDHCV